MLKMVLEATKWGFFKTALKKDLAVNVVNKYHNFYYFSIFHVVNYAIPWIIFKEQTLFLLILASHPNVIYCHEDSA